MKRISNILLPLISILGVLFCASTLRAQGATATMRVTLIVIPAPGISFTPTNPKQISSSSNRGDDGGMTLHTASNVAVVLISSDREKLLESNHSGQGENRILTSKDLHGVSRVEITYLGS